VAAGGCVVEMADLRQLWQRLLPFDENSTASISITISMGEDFCPSGACVASVAMVKVDKSLL
jgi:hypothetical protein